MRDCVSLKTSLRDAKFNIIGSEAKLDTLRVAAKIPRIDFTLMKRCMRSRTTRRSSRSR